MNKQNLSSIPDENRTEELLSKIQPVPSESFHRQMAHAAWRVDGAKESMMTARNNRLKFALVLTIFLVGMVLLATPQGRAFAQSILQFFVRADHDRYPLQPWQMTPPTQTSANSGFVLSVQEAETLAAYDVLSPVEVPSGMVFVGASYDEKYHMVSQAFGQNAEYIELSLWQQPLEYYQPCGDIKQLCDNILGATFVGASAYLETVQIGNQAGEYLEGVWELTNNGPVWNPTPYAKHLRWQTDTMIFELVYNGIDLNRDDIIGLAVSIR